MADEEDSWGSGVFVWHFEEQLSGLKEWRMRGVWLRDAYPLKFLDVVIGDVAE